MVEVYNRELDVEVVQSNNPEDGSIKGFLIKINNEENADLDLHFENVKKVRAHIELLYKNALISLLSSVEWFFSQILHYYYDRHPESAGIQKKTMTLSDLKAMKSIGDAEKYLIDLKIEEILRGNFESWITLLKTELSLGVSYVDPMQDEIIEIYQRRNLFVHNGGVVNSIYISKVKEAYRENVKIYDQLIVKKGYLDNAICKLQKAFILIAAELWKNLDKTDTTRGEVLTNIVYENLLKSRWEICEGLSFFMIKDAGLSVTDKIVAQLNYWLCKKRTGELDLVKKEIDKVDFSDKKEIFQLGLFALKDDKASFFEILPVALDSKQLSIERLEEFPIFKEMRETEEYQIFKKETNYFDSVTLEINGSGSERTES
ncbi:hypothetical protein ACE38W_16035 [Chitinophaga sp. Hz27]|uniref:hypothetical protein n=1 Tax=Chitinophaga sp. Hz27 TaxID=3347169 RepID=UPI0035E149D4